ncbi:hypothetical protein E4T43_05387 [Aureobasidium subglaciale]|nr:hypothetical protein E4T43_05387 [Aureobasidium subglaciale]
MFSTMITVVESDLQTKTVTSKNNNSNNEDHNTAGGITNKQTVPSISAVAHNTINNKVTNHHAGLRASTAPAFYFLAPPIAWSLALIPKPDPIPQTPVPEPCTGVFGPEPEPVPRSPTPDPYLPPPPPPPPPPIFWKALWVYMLAPVHPAM